jgi:hypothetical protein
MISQLNLPQGNLAIAFEYNPRAIVPIKKPIVKIMTATEKEISRLQDEKVSLTD